MVFKSADLFIKIEIETLDKKVLSFKFFISVGLYVVIVTFKYLI